MPRLVIRFREFLRQQPESGMGYQDVDVEMLDGRRLPATVLNADLLVEPAFGHRGGGVEVIFPDGTQPGTVTGPAKIPD